MKTLKTLLLALLFTTTASAQLSITAYGDPVINIVGGDLNNYTEHNPVFNPASITSALNGIISIKIYKRLSLDFHYALRLRTDIEGKLIGGNGDLGLRWEF